MGSGAEKALQAAFKTAMRSALASHSCGSNAGGNPFVWKGGPGRRPLGEDGVSRFNVLIGVKRFSFSLRQPVLEVERESMG